MSSFRLKPIKILFAFFIKAMSVFSPHSLSSRRYCQEIARCGGNTSGSSTTHLLKSTGLRLDSVTPVVIVRAHIIVL